MGNKNLTPCSPCRSHEFNFDGLVGQTHNYSGLSFGNVASDLYRGHVAYPKKAALQGLEKMWFMVGLGLKQAVLPPQERPHIPTLKRIGYSGSDAEILNRVRKENPALLMGVCSAASMWTANAGTVSPGADTRDGKVHFTPANLTNKFHRSLEHHTTTRVFRAIFSDGEHFVVHEALPSGDWLGDEGAANHTRLCESHEKPGVEVFVYGKSGMDQAAQSTKNFPARQTREASESVARLHGLDPERTIFVQQNPEMIDVGVFHNDVISVGNQNVLFYHEAAFVGGDAVLTEIQDKLSRVCQIPFIPLKVLGSDVPPSEAVKTYLFNSQLVTLPDGSMALIAPHECEKSKIVSPYLDALLQDSSHPVRGVHFMDLRQSMQNGGGPACLRLRVVLSDAELAAANPGVFLDEALYNRLKTWIERHYREELRHEDLADPQLIIEVRAALDELTRMLMLGNVYDFQM